MGIADEITGPVDLVLLRFPGNHFTGEVAPALGDAGAAFEDVDGEVSGLLTDEDIEAAGEEMEAESSAALLLFENTWAARFTNALRAADAEVIAFERIPHDALQEFLAGVHE